MDELEQILQQSLNTDVAHLLAKQLSLRAAWQSRVSTQYREAEATLAAAKAKYYGDGSNMDEKKIRVEAAVAREQKIVDELKDKADILKQHISLGQSLLRNFESEVKSGVMSG